MLLHEIISTNDQGTSSILCELLFKYKKSLCTYYSRYYNSELILMVTTVFNAAQYALIVPANEFHEAIDAYLQGSDLTEEERGQEMELISFQSIPFSKF